ncbi:MAG: hypothetical protein ACRD0K_26895 [Egibacteraceae bacterium]
MSDDKPQSYEDWISWRMQRGGWLGVDLDGTLAEYHGWVDSWHIGPPVPAMLARVKAWLEKGYDVRIVTARVSFQGLIESWGYDASEVRAAITRWLIEHVGRSLPITHEKDMAMIELWDDRAVQVIPNTGLRADGKP